MTAIMTYTMLKGGIEGQTTLMNWERIFGKKEAAHVSRKAGLTEYTKATKKTPRIMSSSPKGGESTRKGGPSPSSFGEATKFASSPNSKANGK